MAIRVAGRPRVSRGRKQTAGEASGPQGPEGSGRTGPEGVPAAQAQRGSQAPLSLPGMLSDSREETPP